MTLQIKPVAGGAPADITSEQVLALKTALGLGNVTDEALADKVDASSLALQMTTLTNSVNGSLAEMSTELDTKSPILDFVGATKVGNTVTINQLEALDPASSLLDGQSFLVYAGTSAFGAIGTDTAPQPSGGTYSQLSYSTGTNIWNTRNRGKLTAAAGTGNFARLYHPTKLRFANDNSGILGFKYVVLFAAADTLTTAHAWCGMNTNGSLPAVGAHPSTYSGQRFGLQCAGDDTNRWWKLTFNGTVLKDLGVNFPCDGNEANPYQFEIESIPNAAGLRVTNWKLKHLLTGATDEGTLTGTGPQGNFEPNFSIWRDSNGSATQAAISARGMATGAFRSLVVPTVVSGGGGSGGGGNVTDNSETRIVTASGPLLPTDVNCTIQTNSATAIELSLPSLEDLEATPGKATISIYVNGAGATTIAPQNGVAAPVGTPPSGAQGTFVVLEHVGDKWVYPA